MVSQPRIEIQNQTLIQTVRLAGTPFSLHYRSDRVPGRRAAYSLRIPLSGKKIPRRLKAIALEITLAGKRFTETFPPHPEQTFAFTWDGKDAQGRPASSPQAARIRIGYVYPGFYPRPETTRWKESTQAVGAWDARNCGLGGWTLGVHHAYDPIGCVLYLGNGRRRDKLVVGSDGKPQAEILIPSADGHQVYIFDAAGRHRRTLNALTGTLLYGSEYDSTGRLTAVVDGYRNTTRIERSATGTPSALVAPFGQRTTLVLNDDGYLSAITDPAGATAHFTYGKEGLLAGAATARGHLYRFAYDEKGRLTRQEDPAGGFSELLASRNGQGLQIALNTAQGREFNFLVERLPGGEERRVNKCCGGGQTVSVRGPEGSYKVSTADGAASSLVLEPDPRWGLQSPRIKSFSRTTPGGLAFAVSLSRAVALAERGNPLSLIKQTDALTTNGHSFASVYEAAQKKITNTTPAGRQIVGTLDAHGKIATIETPGRQPVILDYDNHGRLTAVRAGVGAGARVYSFAYDPAKQLASITDPLGRIERLEYGPTGRVTKRILPDGREVRYVFDANSNLTSVTPPGRPEHRFTHNPLNFVEAYFPPDTGAGDQGKRYTYNADKQLSRITCPDGRTIEFLYDETGAISTVAFPGGKLQFVIDPKTRNLITATGPEGVSLSHAYDGFLLTEIIWTGPIQGRLRRTFNKNFRLSSLTVNGGSPIALEYDPDNFLTQVGALTLTRDPQSGLVIGTKLGAVTTTKAYNDFEELTEQRSFFNKKEIFAVRYTRDALKRIIEKVETLEGQTTACTYQYDSAGRLAGVSQEGVQVAQYEHDANGNRLACKGQKGAKRGSYDDQDCLLQYGETSYAHTPNGEWASKTADGKMTRYDYDVFGNLKAVTLPEGRKLEYVMDVWNRRLGKKLDGSLVQGFLYQGPLRPMVELDGQNKVVSRFVYATRPNVPDYMEKGGKTFRILTDPLGSPRLVVDAATGAIVQRMDYDEFGNVVQDTNPGFQPFGFAGGLYDRESGLLHFGARDYDPEAGRWIAKDPLWFAGGDTNFYAYVLNDPVNAVDPMGLYQGIMPPEFCSPEHYNRNINNRCPPRNPTQSGPPSDCPPETAPGAGGDSGGDDQDWVGDPAWAEHIFHGGYDTYRNPATNSQCSYDRNGDLVTDVEFEGTYDYHSPTDQDGGISIFGYDLSETLNHVIHDVAPWIACGSAANYP